MASDFQAKVAKAKEAGYSDEEIRSFVAKTPEYQKAEGAGYKPEEIYSHLGMGAPSASGAQGAPSAQSAPSVSPDDTKRKTDRSIGGEIAAFSEGVMDPIHGAAQMLYNAVPEPVRNAGNAINNAMARGLNPVLEPIGLRMQELNGPEAMNQMIAEREHKIKEAGLPIEGRIAGNILSPVNKIIPGAGVSGKAGVAAKIGGGVISGGTSAALAPTSGEGDYWSQKAAQVGTGATLGGALGVASSAIAGLRPSKNAQKLLNEGIELTPGQIAGKTARSIEEKSKIVPIAGEQIANAENRAIQSFNRATINKALKPIGAQVSEIGNDGIAAGQKALSEAYDRVLPNVILKADKILQADLTNVLKKSAQASGLPQTQREQLQKFLTDRVLGRLQEQGGTLPGDVFKQVDSEIGQFAAQYKSSADAGQRAMANLAGDIGDVLKDTLARQNPAHAKELNNINKAYAMFVRVENAAGRRAGSEGVFSPGDLMAAVKSTDRSVRKRAFAAGRAQMQGWATTANSVLPNRVPDSGTAGRSAVGALGAAVLAGQAPHIGLPALGIMGGGALAYSKPGVSAMRALMLQNAARAGASGGIQSAIPGTIGGLNTLSRE